MLSSKFLFSFLVISFVDSPMDFLSGKQAGSARLAPSVVSGHHVVQGGVLSDLGMYRLTKF